MVKFLQFIDVVGKTRQDVSGQIDAGDISLAFLGNDNRRQAFYEVTGNVQFFR